MLFGEYESRRQNTYSPVVIGDFNKGNLTHKLPKYKQSIRLRSYSSDTEYRQKLKLSKPAVRRSKNWSSREAVEELPGQHRLGHF